MTKEQAIEILRCRTNLGYGIVIENESTQVIEEALDLAIKVLEQQPCDDCVSRQAVKDIIHEYKNNIDSQLSWLSDGVCDLPPVTPTQKTCKDCKHYHEKSWICDLTVLARKKDFYCADFERRE